MIIEDNSFMLDPAMGTERGEADTEFPIRRNAEDVQIPDKEQAAEQAGFVPGRG